VGHFERKFQTEEDVAHRPLLVSKKLEWLAFRVVSKCPHSAVHCLVSLQSTYVIDRQTDGENYDSQLAYSCVAR